tara:strand:+ start:198 stop:377 length:180 start_codon:yes stop_codon:yes gene_type:complete
VKKQADRQKNKKVKKADREKQKGGEKIDSHQKSVKNYDDDESFWCLRCAMVLFFYYVHS